MIDELKELLLRIGAWLLAIALGGIGLLIILRVILPRLADTATAFIATPGGLFVVIAIWWWLRRKKSH